MANSHLEPTMSTTKRKVGMSDPELFCSICNLPCHTFAVLQQHMKSSHSLARCPKCKITLKLNLILRHFTECHLEDCITTCVCFKCEQHFSSPSAFNYHYSQEHEPYTEVSSRTTDTTVMCCPICKVELKTKRRRNNHLMKYHGIHKDDLDEYDESSGDETLNEDQQQSDCSTQRNEPDVQVPDQTTLPDFCSTEKSLDGDVENVQRLVKCPKCKFSDTKVSKVCTIIQSGQYIMTYRCYKCGETLPDYDVYQEHFVENNSESEDRLAVNTPNVKSEDLDDSDEGRMEIDTQSIKVECPDEPVLDVVDKDKEDLMKSLETLKAVDDYGQSDDKDRILNMSPVKLEPVKSVEVDQCKNEDGIATQNAETDVQGKMSSIDLIPVHVLNNQSDDITMPPVNIEPITSIEVAKCTNDNNNTTPNAETDVERTKSKKSMPVKTKGAKSATDVQGKISSNDSIPVHALNNLSDYIDGMFNVPPVNIEPITSIEVAKCTNDNNNTTPNAETDVERTKSKKSIPVKTKGDKPAKGSKRTNKVCYTCFCKRVFSTFAAFEKHLSEEHSLVACSQCPLIAKPGLMLKHSCKPPVDKNENTYKCSECDIKFSHLKELMDHYKLRIHGCPVKVNMADKHPSKQQHQSKIHGASSENSTNREGTKYMCTRCTNRYTYSSYKELHHHMKQRHHLYVCPKCLIIASLMKMVKHYKECHFDNMENMSHCVCFKCGHISPDPESFHQHFAQHKSQEPDKPWMKKDKPILLLNKKELVAPPKLKLHPVYISQAQDLLVDLHCRVHKCGKKFLNLADLTAHIQVHQFYLFGANTVHKLAQSIDNFSSFTNCIECGVKLGCESDAEDHMTKYHKKANRPFPCATCPASFFMYGSLVSHQDIIHDYVRNRSLSPEVLERMPLSIVECAKLSIALSTNITPLEKRAAGDMSVSTQCMMCCKTCAGVIDGIWHMRKIHQLVEAHEIASHLYIRMSVDTMADGDEPDECPLSTSPVSDQLADDDSRLSKDQSEAVGTTVTPPDDKSNTYPEISSNIPTSPDQDVKDHLGNSDMKTLAVTEKPIQLTSCPKEPTSISIPIAVKPSTKASLLSDQTVAVKSYQDKPVLTDKGIERNKKVSNHEDLLDHNRQIHGCLGVVKTANKSKPQRQQVLKQPKRSKPVRRQMSFDMRGLKVTNNITTTFTQFLKKVDARTMKQSSKSSKRKSSSMTIDMRGMAGIPANIELTNYARKPMSVSSSGSDRTTLDSIEGPLPEPPSKVLKLSNPIVIVPDDMGGEL